MAEETAGPVARPGREPEAGAWVFLVLMVLIGSTTATSAKFAVRELPVGLLAITRFGVAALCLLPFVDRAAIARMAREDGLRLLAASACCVPINQAFFLSGTQRAPTTHVGIIYATCPLVVLLLAAALGQERITWRRLVGAIVTVAGAGVLALGNLTGAGAESDSGAHLKGDGLLVGAVLAWGVYLTLNRPLVRRHGSLVTLTGTFLVGSVLAIPLAAWSLALESPALGAASRTAWAGLAYLALVVTVVGLACQNQALRRLEASQVATVGNAAPVLTVLWGALLFGEALTPSLIAGGALVLGGILWTNRSNALNR